MSSGTRFFAIDYSDMGPVSLWTEKRQGGGPGRGGVEVDSPRQPSPLFLKGKISSLTISLVNPDDFIAAVEDRY